MYLIASACALAFVFNGCGSAVSIDDGGLSSGTSPHDEDQVIIQTRQDGDHLDVFTLGQPSSPGVSPRPFTQEEREKDYLSGRPAAVQGRNINGSIYRHPIVWDMSTEQGTSRPRVSLDGGDGAYTTDFAIETVRTVSLPSADGTYNYAYVVKNEASEYNTSYTTSYTYTRSGSSATVLWRDFSGAVYQLHSGSPLNSLGVGFGMTLLNPFGFANEATQDARYTGTWTIYEDFNGVTGQTGKFDLRRLALRNFKVDPPKFNPAADQTTTISADFIALPTTTELTPGGWSPSGPISWLVEIDDPLVPGSVIRSLSGSTQPQAPDENGKVGSLVQTWDGKDSAGEILLSGTYPFRTQALAALSSGNLITKETPAAVQLGTRVVSIKNLTADPEEFEPEEEETTTISFDIETSGFENPNLSWEVHVYKQGEVEGEEEKLHSFPLPEDPVKASSTNVSIEWDGQSASGPISGEVEYRVMAKACDENVSARSADPVRQRVLFQIDEGSCSFTNETLAGKLGSDIKIINEDFTPKPPFEHAGSSVTLTADVVVTKSGDYDISWTVGIKDADENPVIPVLTTGEGSSVRAEWDGTINDNPVEDPASYQFFIEARACPVEEESGAGDGARLQSLELEEEPERCPEADKLVALGGNRAVISFYDLSGGEMSEIEPSYAFQVVQSLDVIDRNGQDPGTQDGEHIVVPEVKPSVARVDVEFISVRTKDESYTIKVEWENTGLGGHRHDNVAPPGILAKTANELLKDYEALSSGQKSKIGDGGVSITASEEISVDIARGERKITLYYLAPISSDERAFRVFKEGDSKEVGSKRLLIGFRRLESLAGRLSASGVDFVQDSPARPPEPPGGIILTGFTSNHSNNLNGIPEFNTRLVYLARLWSKSEETRTLRYNDMSLPLGGKFDIDGRYEIRARHTEHRWGENIDINTDLTRAKKRDSALEGYVKQAGLAVYSELEDSHYHLRLFGKGGN